MEHIENDEQFQGLRVNKGTSEQPTVNPYLNNFKKFKRKTYTASEYVEGILKGNITILGAGCNPY